MKSDRAPENAVPRTMSRRRLWLSISGVALAVWLLVLIGLAWRG